jgi:hypothetical protein
MAPSAALAVINTSSPPSKKVSLFPGLPAFVKPKSHLKAPTEEWGVTLGDDDMRSTPLDLSL